VVERFVESRFETQTDPWGAAWAAVSATTLALREKLGGGDALALASKVYMRLRTRGRRIVVGIAGSAGRARQFGAPNNRIFGRAPAPIPPRPAMPLRGGRIDLPGGLREQLMDAFREGIRSAVRNLRSRS